MADAGGIDYEGLAALDESTVQSPGYDESRGTWGEAWDTAKQYAGPIAVVAGATNPITAPYALTAGAGMAAHSALKSAEDEARQTAARETAERDELLANTPQVPPQAPPGQYQPRGVNMHGLGALRRKMAQTAEGRKARIEGYTGEGGAVAEAADRQREALTYEADLAEQRAAEEASLRQRQVAAREEQEAQRRNAEGFRRSEMQRVRDMARAAQAEANAYKVGLREETAGTKAKNFFAAILGGIGSGLTGGPNLALAAIDKKNASELARQREELAGKRAAVKGFRNELDMLREQFGDDRLAEKALELRQLQRDKTELEKLASEYKGPEAVAAKEKALAAMDAKIAQVNLDMLDRADANAQASLAQQANIAAQQAQLGLQGEKLQAAGQRGAKPLSEQSAKGLANVRASLNELRDLKNTFEKNTSWGSVITENLPWTPSRAMNAKIQNARMKFQKALTGTGMGQKEREEFMQMFPTASTWDELAANQFDALIRSMEYEEQSLVDTLQATGRAVPQAPIRGRAVD